MTENLSLDALRRDGVHQQQFVLNSPDFYPIVPSLSELVGIRVPQAIRRIGGHIHAPSMGQAGVGVERQLPRNFVLAVNYLHSRGWHSLRSRALTPTSSMTPSDVTAVYLYESSGTFKQDQLVTTLNGRVNPKVSFNGSYTLGNATSDTDSAGTFAANSYDLHREYGRAGFDVRHRVQFSGAFAFPLGVRLSPRLVATSTRPFNVIVGRDLNGDTLFTDRPAFAADLSLGPRVHGWRDQESGLRR